MDSDMLDEPLSGDTTADGDNCSFSSSMSMSAQSAKSCSCVVEKEVELALLLLSSVSSLRRTVSTITDSLCHTLSRLSALSDCQNCCRGALLLRRSRTRLVSRALLRRSLPSLAFASLCRIHKATSILLATHTANEKNPSERNHAGLSHSTEPPLLPPLQRLPFAGAGAGESPAVHG